MIRILAEQGKSLGAIVAAGSAVSRDVADGELRIVRAEQLVKPGWADRFHDAMRKKKAEKR
jgi:bifunctional UDP-N-acetylglucosamine pyrophosphorylase / glucosamine-1-phosphate N-acetyltransferase